MGPKSEEGKARVSRNPYKGGTRARLRELGRLLREQCEALKRIGEALVLVVATLAKAPGEVPVHPPETAGQRLVEYLLRQFIQNKSSSPLMRGCA